MLVRGEYKYLYIHNAAGDCWIISQAKYMFWNYDWGQPQVSFPLTTIQASWLRSNRKKHRSSKAFMLFLAFMPFSASGSHHYSMDLPTISYLSFFLSQAITAGGVCLVARTNSNNIHQSLPPSVAAWLRREHGNLDTVPCGFYHKLVSLNFWHQ